MDTRDEGQFVEITIYEGTLCAARFVLHPDGERAAIRAAVAPFATHPPLAAQLLQCAASLQLAPWIQVKLLVLIEMISAELEADESTGNTDHEDEDSIPF